MCDGGTADVGIFWKISFVKRLGIITIPNFFPNRIKHPQVDPPRLGTR